MRRVELLRIADMECGQQIPLHLEQVLGIAEVCGQVGRDLRARLDDGAAERFVPRREDRIPFVELVQGHRAVVSVHCGLD
jgi:hypothetical protein